MSDALTRNSTRQEDVLHHLHSMTNPIEFEKNGPTFVESASGIYLMIDGHSVIDGMSGMACSNVGYGNQKICDAASRAMRNISYAHSFMGQSNADSAMLAAKLASLTDDKFTKFFFASTGSDGNESAVKIVWHYWTLKGQPQRRLLISRRHAYHGNTVLATCLTGIPHYHEQFGLPLKGLVRHIGAPYHYRYGAGLTSGDFALKAARELETAILEAGAENVAAFIAEPVQGAGGMIVPPPGYFDEVQRICRQYGVLFISDEVITGFGKLGSMFGYQHFDFEPDIIVCAKGMTSAYFPMSAVGVSGAIARVLDTSDADFVHGFTNCAHPVGAAVALANIAEIEDRHLVAHVREHLGPGLAAGLQKFISHPFVGDIRSSGVMGAIEFKTADGIDENAQSLSAAIVAEARRNGLIVRPNGSSLVITLPMITTLHELDMVLKAIGDAIETVTGTASE